MTRRRKAADKALTKDQLRAVIADVNSGSSAERLAQKYGCGLRQAYEMKTAVELAHLTRQF